MQDFAAGFIIEKCLFGL